MLIDMTAKAVAPHASQIMSSVTGAVRQWLLEQFRPGFFKTVRIVNGASSVQDIEGDADRLLAYRKQNPAMAIKAHINFQEDILGAPLKNPNPFRYEDYGPDSHFYGVYKDEKHMQSITMLIDYWKMAFDVAFRVETEMQLIDLTAYINKRCFPENYFYIQNTTFPVEIPNGILVQIAEDLKIDIRTKKGVDVLVSHMRRCMILPADIAVDQASGRTIIAFLMSANILAKIEKLGEPTPNKKGKSIMDSRMGMQMTAQVGYPSLFKCRTEAPVPKPEGWEPLTEIGQFKVGSNSSQGAGAPIYIYTTLKEAPFELPVSHHKLVWQTKFVTGVDAAVETLQIKEALPYPIQSCIRKYVDAGRNLELNDIFTPHVFKDGSLIDESEFTFDWDKLELRFLLGPFRNYIYSMLLYADLPKIQESELLDLDERDQLDDYFMKGIPV